MQSTQAIQQFDIRKFSESLTQAKGGRYVCPSCDEPKLGIASSGKYQCWGCRDTKAIARILTEPERQEKRQREESERIAASKTSGERIAEWTEGSAVRQSIADANIKHIEDKPLIASLLGWKWYSHTPGWYVLSCDPITGKRGKDGQFKPDTSIKFPDNDDSQKYISFPKGSKNSAVYLALTLDDWIQISEKLGVAIADEEIDESRDDLGFWLWVLNHPELPVCLTEGTKKAGSLLSHGWIAISISGVWSGQIGKGKKLHPSIAPFIVPGRRVYTAFDSDILQNPNVEAALRQLGHLIKREKAEIFICSWEQEKGIDDLIVRYGGEILKSLQEQALPYGEWLKALKSTGQMGQELHRESLNSQTSNGGSGNGSGGGDGGSDGDDDSNYKPDPDDKHPEAFYRPVCNHLRLPFDNCVTAGTFDNWAYRSEFGADEGNWRVIDAAFYRWDEKSGYWSHQPDNRINTLIADAGDKAFKLKHTKEFGWQTAYPYATNSHKESAFKYCRSRLERPEPLPVNMHLRAFKNCVVDLRTGARMPHEKEHFLTSIIPYDYEPGKECPEIFRQFIADSFGEDMLDVIRAFTSMFLDPTAPYGRFPHLIGQSGGGKGSLGRFWSSLFGEDGASGGDFSNLSTAEGRHQYLSGKSIFAIPDAGGYICGLRSFYELLDNGPLSGRALFNPVGYFKTWNVRFWVASVDCLQFENSGDGWARRAYPIPVKARTVRPDPDLRLKLEAVKAEVISWALAMPRADRDRILLSPPENERVINLALDTALYGDSTKSFVDLCLRPNTEPGFVPNHLLHTWYAAYCQEHGYTPLGMSKFISHLKTVLPRNFADRAWTPMIDGRRSKIAAHWEFIAPVPNAFYKTDVEVEVDPFEGRREKNNPAWICIKANCEEGGLMDFEDFWNPPQPPSEDSDNKQSNACLTIPTLPSPSPTDPPQSGTGGTGWYKNSQIAETTQNQGGRGGTGWAGVICPSQNSNDSLVEKIEASVEVEKFLTPIEEGVPPVSTPDSFNVCQEAVKYDEIVRNGEIQQVTAIQPEVVQDVVIEDDPWMLEENLAAIAEDLNECPDQETLDLLRQCWSAPAMNLACKRLSPQRHSQIKAWVVELNGAASQSNEEELVQAQLFPMISGEQVRHMAPGDWEWEEFLEEF